MEKNNLTQLKTTWINVKILSNLIFFARQVLGIRGHDEECNSNFSQL